MTTSNQTQSPKTSKAAPSSRTMNTQPVIAEILSDSLARDREGLQREEEARIDRERQEVLARQRELARFD